MNKMIMRLRIWKDRRGQDLIAPLGIFPVHEGGRSGSIVFTIRR
jgi:hypothetical protein